MATHDYDIANQSGAAFRTDLNSALAAIQSNNSNSSSPATTVSYQWWADTTSGTLKIRNAANNAWIELFQLDGTLTLEDGSASSPALGFRDDLNTGIFSSAANTFNVATGGVERMELGATTIFNEDGADVDFRIEGDTAQNLFYVDAGNNRIGIRTSTPSTLLELNGGGNATLTINTGNSSGDNSQIAFADSDDSNVGFINYDHGTNNMQFRVNQLQRMVIDDTGDVGIGSNTISLQGTNRTTVSINGTNESALCFNRSDTITGFIFTDSGEFRIQAEAGASNLVKIRNNNGTICQFDDDGIKFNGDTAAVNGLDDYEEGDFTFHLRSEGGTNASMSGRVGRYVKIGQTVHIIGGGIYSGDPDNRSASNAIEFTNLPFTNVNTSVGSSGFPFPVMMTSLDSTGLSNMNGNQPYVFLGRLDDNATSGRIVGFKSDGNQGPQNASLAVANNTQLYCMFTYQTTA
tara:strand:- start:903 stop:2288 length:1386 start_codon:yes stop_codon:yes gene_type:complete